MRRFLPAFFFFLLSVALYAQTPWEWERTDLSSPSSLQLFSPPELSPETIGCRPCLTGEETVSNSTSESSRAKLTGLESRCEGCGGLYLGLTRITTSSTAKDPGEKRE